MSVAEFAQMTEEEMVLHIFAESADSTMSKVALDILSTAEPTLAELRNKVTEVENSIWYKGGQGLARSAVTREERYCENVTEELITPRIVGARAQSAKD